MACHFTLIDVSNYIIFSPLVTGTCFSIIISHSKACRQPISLFLCSPPPQKKRITLIVIMMDREILLTGNPVKSYVVC